MNVSRQVLAGWIGVQMAIAAGIGVVPAQGADEDGWVSLFDGKTLDGWGFRFVKDSTENEGTYTIEDGVLHCTGKPKGYIVTDRAYTNYTLKVDYAFVRPEVVEDEAELNGNSGVLVHCSEGKGIGVWPRSIEVQGMHRDMARILPIPRSLQCKHTDDKAVREKVRNPYGEWNALEIRIQGGDMVILLNGTKISTVSDCELTDGTIALQSEGAPTRWKNIRIREE